ncbi:MAG: hypothetical protein M3380_18095, partial [Chloroflexota bacterium]|nr:hypothetical protein [Chloroflexota bacterium]
CYINQAGIQSGGTNQEAVSNRDRSLSSYNRCVTYTYQGQLIVRALLDFSMSDEGMRGQTYTRAPAAKQHRKPRQQG